MIHGHDDPQIARARAHGCATAPRRRRRKANRKLGTVEAVRGCHVFPDTAAVGGGENPQWLYAVVFTARELCGEETDPSIKVSIEAFEPYLLPA